MNKKIDRILLLKPNTIIADGIAILWTLLCIMYLFDIPAHFYIKQNSTEVNPAESQRLFIDYGNDSILDSIYPIPNSTLTRVSVVDDRKNSVKSNDNYCLSGHEADIWYLGRNGIKWINDTPIVFTGFADNTSEVNASICDKAGDLLLYSNGTFIFNKYHEKLATIILKGGGSSSMFLILPQPGNDSIYYVFHPQAQYGIINDTIFNLYYTIINVNANLQHGKVVSLSQLLMKTSSEKITGIRHCNGRDWWVLGLRSTDEAFHSWVLSDTGLTVNSPVISYSGKVNHLLTYDQENIGWLKPSHDGRLLLEITTGGQLYSTAELHRFNNATGEIYDGITLIDQEDKYNDLYSAEFSPNNSKIYYTGHRLRNGYDLYQMEVSIHDSSLIRNSIQEIAATQANIGSPILGKDGKIYITNWGSKSDFLHVINKPNLIGSACDFNYFAFPLGSKSSLGAPLFASGFQFPYKVYVQGPNTFCQDTTVRYIITDPCPHPTAQWSIIGGGSIVRQSGDTLDVYYAKAGKYRIAASYPTDCGMKTDTVKVEVQRCNCLTQLSWSVIDTLVCEGANAQFKFITNSTEVYIDNQRITTDSFAMNNLQSDTCFNLMLSYPRFCDSLISICIKVAPIYSSTQEYTLCPNDSIMIDNIWLKRDTSFQLKYVSHLLCDSIVDISIHQYGVDTNSLKLEYCLGDTAIIFNRIIFSDTKLEQLFQSTSGCYDSLQVVNIVFSKNAKVNDIIIERCYADSVIILDKWYHEDTIIYDTLNSHNSCDSIVIFSIRIKSEITPKHLNYNLCNGDTLNITTATGFERISESRDLEDHWTTPSGCDSLIIHHIEVLPTYTSSLIIKKCTNDSIFYNDKYYLKPIVFTETLTSVNGCDSITTIEISDYQESMTSTETWNLCYGDSFTLNGNWLNSDTSLSTIYQNIYGCDSVHQVIVKYFPKVAENTIEFNICKGDSIFLNGLYYKDSTLIKSNLKNGNGCDSIVNIIIAVFPESSRSSEQHFICPGDSILIDNKYYNDTIQLVKRMQDRNGCDSIHTISISVLSGPQPQSEVLHFCKGDSIYLNSQWYKVPENIMIRKSTTGACDSIFNYTLVVYPEINIDLIPELTIEKGMTFVLDPGSISGDLKYNWHPSDDLSCSDCRNPVLTSNSSMTYYLEIIDSHGCITIDSIVINVFDQNEDRIFFPSIFSPNGDNTNDVWQPIPSNQGIKLMKLDIFDRWGQRVYHWTHDISHSSIPA
ncbi:MAG: gliding motility-associated C-terminal domain-containing protein [Saprospiraceae bacterium]|uniref:Gliding motility-associated C-terminal domain-containing protein n=1 Tax=Candidatus Defluviibacterium haderslevense TaxID=2981993 RepID=A0A9D7S7L2_9BACT|nr:gliding motility-associated C-terminal domain-containing protein [Candidatus Defluviibacterium haderslevense]